MQKRGFTIIEVVVVFLLILVVAFFVLPKSLDTTKQASLISHWSEVYSDMEYMFSVIKAQRDGDIQQRLSAAKTTESRTKIILEEIKPYLRIKSEVTDKDYIQYYMNGAPVRKGNKYYFNKFYLMESGTIVGLKWFVTKDSDKRACGIMAFDVNGEKLPNTWGKDVFGIDVFQDRIAPMGKNIDEDTLKADCSKSGYGVYCSYYYLIGGKFD